VHDFVIFSYSFIFYASFYSSCVSCSSSYGGVRDFLIDLGHYVLAIGERSVHEQRLFRIDYFFTWRAVEWRHKVLVTTWLNLSKLLAKTFGSALVNGNLGGYFSNWVFLRVCQGGGRHHLGTIR